MDFKFAILKLGEGALLEAQEEFNKMLTKTIKTTYIIKMISMV